MSDSCVHGLYSGPRNILKALRTSNKEEGDLGVLGVRCSSNTMVCINTFLANANSLITSNSFSSENQTGFLKFL